MILQSKRLWIASQFTAGQIEIQKGLISNIRPYGSRIPDFDFGDRRIVPGFIDIHAHGALGFDTNDGEEDGLRRWIAALPFEGVTGILPATITQNPAVLQRALSNIRSTAEKGPPGSQILGIHLEGPYLEHTHRGAHPENWLATADLAQFRQFQQTSGNMIRIITLAPEMDPDFSLTRFCHRQGIVVSLGHSNASMEHAVMAQANGAVSFTHVYNGMSPFHHRTPGLVNAALVISDMYGEIIADGFHSTWTSVRQFCQIKGPFHCILVTDSLRAKGLPPGVYTSGGMNIETDPEGHAWLYGTRTLAGSTLRMNEGLKNLVENALIPFETALNACTLNPARLLRLEHTKGRICTDYDADLTILEDNYNIHATFCRGIPYMS